MLLTKILFPVLAHLAILTNAGLFNPVNRESPECANINRGQHLCCAMTIDGDQPPVVALALLAGYNLNRNSINGIACKETWDVCNWTELCCQVTGLVPILVLYCKAFTTSATTTSANSTAHCTG